MYRFRPIETAEQSEMRQREREQIFLMQRSAEQQQERMAAAMLAARADMPPGAPLSAGLQARAALLGAPQRESEQATRAAAGPRTLDLDF